MYGEAQARVIEAVPPLLAWVRLAPPDATTTELLLEYEVLQTTGRMYYALCEAEAADKGGKVTQQKTRISTVYRYALPEPRTGARCTSGWPSSNEDTHATHTFVFVASSRTRGRQRHYIHDFTTCV